MFDQKKLASLRKRIMKADQSLSVMGNMVLEYEFDAMTSAERKQLFDYLFLKGCGYPGCSVKYLMKLIKAEQGNA